MNFFFLLITCIIRIWTRIITRKQNYHKLLSYASCVFSFILIRILRGFHEYKNISKIWCDAHLQRNLCQLMFDVLIKMDKTLKATNGHPLENDKFEDGIHNKRNCWIKLHWQNGSISFILFIYFTFSTTLSWYGLIFHHSSYSHSISHASLSLSVQQWSQRDTFGPEFLDPNQIRRHKLTNSQL